jgi:hypothetical protein
MAALAMGTFVTVAHFGDYGPLLSIGVGETLLVIPFVVGLALGFLLTDDEPQFLVAKGFLAALGAIALIASAVYAPVLVGVVQTLDQLGAAQPARLASLFTAMFIVPFHIVGTVVGRAIAELLFPGHFLGTEG